MRREAKSFSGDEITTEVLFKMNSIILRRIKEEGTSRFFDLFDALRDLFYYNDRQLLRTVVGEDWFLAYFVKNTGVELGLWVSCDSTCDKFCQSMEMYNSFKRILLENRDLSFSARVLHDTSYRFYESFVRRGFATENSNDCFLSSSLPNDLALELKRLDGKDSLFFEVFFKDDDVENRFQKYVYHNINFDVTDKFVKTYHK